MTYFVSHHLSPNVAEFWLTELDTVFWTTIFGIILGPESFRILGRGTGGSVIIDNF